MSDHLQRIEELSVELFADGADLEDIRRLAELPVHPRLHDQPHADAQGGGGRLQGFRARGAAARSRPPAGLFEVFADEFAEMERNRRSTFASGPQRERREIPATNTRREFSGRPDRRVLSTVGVHLNVTAADGAGAGGAHHGAPCARNACHRVGLRGPYRRHRPVIQCRSWPMRCACCARAPRPELICTSPRELLNVFQADAVGCHIITATNDILKSSRWSERTCTDYSLETVEMFHRDASAAGYGIAKRQSAA